MSDAVFNLPILDAHPSPPSAGRCKRYVFDDGASTPEPFYMLSDGVPRPAVTAGGISEADLRNILDRFIEQNDTIDNNTTNASITRHNVDRTPLHTDGYIVLATFIWNHSNASTDGRVELLIDGNVVRTMRLEPKDPGADQRCDGSLRYIHPATQGTLFNVEVRFDRANNSNTTSMYSSELSIDREFGL